MDEALPIEVRGFITITCLHHEYITFYTYCQVSGVGRIGSNCGRQEDLWLVRLMEKRPICSPLATDRGLPRTNLTPVPRRWPRWLLAGGIKTRPLPTLRWIAPVLVSVSYGWVRSPCAQEYRVASGVGSLRDSVAIRLFGILPLSSWDFLSSLVCRSSVSDPVSQSVLVIWE